jgi:hypothetical protein
LDFYASRAKNITGTITGGMVAGYRINPLRHLKGSLAAAGFPELILIFLFYGVIFLGCQCAGGAFTSVHN